MRYRPLVINHQNVMAKSNVLSPFKWTVKLKREASKALLSLANIYEPKKRKRLMGVKYFKYGRAEWSSTKIIYGAIPYYSLGRTLFRTDKRNRGI